MFCIFTSYMLLYFTGYIKLLMSYYHDKTRVADSTELQVIHFYDKFSVNEE